MIQGSFRLAYLVGLFLFLTSLLSAQSLGLLIDGKKPHAKIPFELINNFIVIELTFDHVLPLNFIFDTGAENTLITKKEIVDLFEYKLGRKFTVIGSDMKTPLTAYLVQSVHLSTEHTTAAHQDILVLEEDYIKFGKFLGKEIHGIAAADLFKRHVVKVDYKKKELILYKKKPPIPSDFKKVKVSIEKSKLYVQSPVNIIKDEPFSAKLLIDTGADMGLLINTKSDSLLHLPENRLPSTIGIGLGGYLEGYIGRINKLQFGTYELDNLIGNFQDDVTTAADSLNILSRNGIIGNKILGRFTLFIDLSLIHI